MRNDSNIALAWLLHQGDDICLIPGTKRIKYLEQNLAAAEVVLSAAQLSQLDELSSGFEVEGARYG